MNNKNNDDFEHSGPEKDPWEVGFKKQDIPAEESNRETPSDTPEQSDEPAREENTDGTGETAATVSYTHLTLPTIYSV